MNDQPAPDLSVLICVKDGAAELPIALGSLERQTTQHFEVVVVDDHSSDHSREIAQAHHVVSRIVDGPGLGLAMARNVGLRSVRGRYITFLDHDDLFHPTRIERINHWATTHAEVPWFWTGFRTFAALDEPTSDDCVVLDSEWPDALVRRGRELDVLAVDESALDVTGSDSTVVRAHENTLNWGAAGAPLVARVDLLCDAGGFPTHLGPAEDVLMLLNIARRAPIAEIDQPTYFYRLRADSETRSMRLPWAYLSAVISARFGGQHMTSDRALGREAPIPRDKILEDLISRSIGREGFNGAIKPLFHMLCLLYPDRSDRRAIMKRIMVEWLRTRNPKIDLACHRLRLMFERDRFDSGDNDEGEVDR